MVCRQTKAARRMLRQWGRQAQVSRGMVAVVAWRYVNTGNSGISGRQQARLYVSAIPDVGVTLGAARWWGRNVRNKKYITGAMFTVLHVHCWYRLKTPPCAKCHVTLPQVGKLVVRRSRQASGRQMAGRLSWLAVRQRCTRIAARFILPRKRHHLSVASHVARHHRMRLAGPSSGYDASELRYPVTGSDFTAGDGRRQYH